MKLSCQLEGLGLRGSKWQQVAANRYFDSTIDALKSCECAPRRGGHIRTRGSRKKGEREMRVDTELEALKGLAKTMCRKRTGSSQ
jgi:hypothetical protein